MNYFNYFTEIEETFIRRRAKNLLLSPLDWALMEIWQERGVPLHVVIRAIEQVFDVFEKNPGPRVIKSLMFCREEVEAQYEEWLKGQAGKGSELEPPAREYPRVETEGFIKGLIAVLKRNTNKQLCDELERACVRLSEIAENLTSDMELLDKSLSDVESMIDSALISKTARVRLKSFEKEIESQLRPYKGQMEAASYAATHRLMLLKRLREEEGIPRLSMFFL